MASKFEFKVNTDTIKKINCLINEKNISQEIITDTLDSAINKLWETAYTNQSMLRVEKVDIEVTPKKDHKKEITAILGKEKTYSAIKIYKSWLGISDGLYQFKGSSNLFPVSWFLIKTKKNNKYMKYIKYSAASVATILIFLLA